MRRYLAWTFLATLSVIIGVSFCRTKWNHSSVFIASLEANESHFRYTCMLCAKGMPPHGSDYQYLIPIYFRHSSKVVPDQASVCEICIKRCGWPLDEDLQKLVLRHWIERRTHEDISTLGVLEHDYAAAQLSASDVK